MVSHVKGMHYLVIINGSAGALERLQSAVVGRGSVSEPAGVSVETPSLVALLLSSGTDVLPALVKAWNQIHTASCPLDNAISRAGRFIVFESKSVFIIG